MSWADLPQIIRLLAALALVVALMGGLAYILKRLGLGGMPDVRPKTRRLKLIESLPLDARRRALLFQCDEKQHLVILSPNSETVVETGIKPVKDDDA